MREQYHVVLVWIMTLLGAAEGNIRRSTRKQLTYTSSWQTAEKMKCIICNDDKRAKGRLLPLQTIRISDKAESTLREYANLHLEKNNVKYVDGARRILLTLATKSLLAADVAYHKKTMLRAIQESSLETRDIASRQFDRNI